MSPLPEPAEPSLPAASLRDPEVLLVFYLRALAVFFLVAGMIRWVRLLGLPDSPTGALLGLPISERVETIAYAVLDPVASVGLWLVTAWGIVVWLIAAVSRIVLSSGLGTTRQPDMVQLALHAASILVYLGLSHFVRRNQTQREQQGRA